jgi:hypothetical protein
MKKILSVLSNYGYWGVELTGPMVKLEQAGYELVFATPKGARPIALPPSYDEKYWDPPLGTFVNSRFDVEQVKSRKDSPKLDHPINISEWMPERPYFSVQNFIREWEKYFKIVRERYKELEQYAGLLRTVLMAVEAALGLRPSRDRFRLIVWGACTRSSTICVTTVTRWTSLAGRIRRTSRCSRPRRAPRNGSADRSLHDHRTRRTIHPSAPSSRENTRDLTKSTMASDMFTFMTRKSDISTRENSALWTHEDDTKEISYKGVRPEKNVGISQDLQIGALNVY